MVLRDVANSICEFTTFKTDCPSANASGWMPLLDIQIRVQPNNNISWKFYEKAVSSSPEVRGTNTKAPASYALPSAGAPQFTLEKAAIMPILALETMPVTSEHKISQMHLQNTLLKITQKLTQHNERTPSISRC